MWNLRNRLGQLLRKLRKSKNFGLALRIYGASNHLFDFVYSLQAWVEKTTSTRVPVRILPIHGVRSRGYGGDLLRLSPFARYFSHVATHTKSGIVTFRPPEGPIDSIYLIESSPDKRTEVFKTLAKTGASRIFFGSEDCTFPRQIDIRWKGASLAEQATLKKIVSNPGQLWFSENIDETVPNVFAIPGGLLGNGLMQQWRFVRSGPFELKRHHGKLVFISHRIRSDSQFDARRQVTTLGETAWSEFSFTVRPVEDENLTGSEMDITTWRKLAGKFTFVACVEGGGLSPSPKFFDVLLAGAIPIIRESPISAVHQMLPCVVVKDWSSKSLSEEFLLQQFNQISANWSNWGAVYEKMTQDFWGNYVARFPDGLHHPIKPAEETESKE